MDMRMCVYRCVPAYVYYHIFIYIYSHICKYKSDTRTGRRLWSHCPHPNHLSPPNLTTPSGFFCVLLSRRRGLISAAERDRILAAMRGIGLPTMVPRCSVAMLHKVCIRMFI